MRARWIWIIALLQMIVVLMLIFAATTPATAAPAAAILDQEPQVVTIKGAEQSATKKAPRPVPTIHEYNISQTTIEKYARAFWGLNTASEKFAFAGIAVHRAMCAEKTASGAYRFPSASYDRFAGVVTSSEFEFYREDAPASKANIELARLYINVHLTMTLTKDYTGYVFPSWALYMGWTSDRTCAVYDNIGGNEFLVKRGK